MNEMSGAVNAVKGALRGAVAVGRMMAVVGERFAGREGRLLADDAFAFDHVLVPIFPSYDPSASFQGDARIRQVGDGDEVNEGVRCVGLEHIGVEEIDEAIQCGS